MIDHIEAAYEQHDRDQMLDYIDTLKERIREREALLRSAYNAINFLQDPMAGPFDALLNEIENALED